jgi:hypothetical protein
MADTIEVEFLVPMACAENDRNVGQTKHVPAGEAGRLIEAGFAKAVGDAPRKGKPGRPAKAAAEGE